MSLPTVIEIGMIVSVSLYSAVLICFFAGLFRPVRARSQERPFVSVVVAARNEDRTIGLLLGDLVAQEYPAGLYEVIVADDGSSDRTGDVVRSMAAKHALIRYISIRTQIKGLTAKKNALAQGIENAKGDLILTVDADCRVLPTWIRTMVSYFTPEVGMVAGFSQLGAPGQKRTVFETLQALDFLALMSAGQGSLNLGIAWAASGQNLAYRKRAYGEVGGFQKVGHRLSGDDVLLMQLLRKHTSWKIRFASDPAAFNTSKPESTVAGLLRQRTRWASNGAYQLFLNPAFFLYAVDTYLANLLLLLSLPLLAFGLSPWILLFCLFLKLSSEALLLLRGSEVFRRKDLLALFPLWFLWQVPYVVFTGAAGTLGRISWKERSAKPVWNP